MRAGRTDQADRRSSRLFLTAGGEAMHAELHEHGLRLPAQALAGLGADERQQLAVLLLRVQENLGGNPGEG